MSTPTEQLPAYLRRRLLERALVLEEEANHANRMERGPEFILKSAVACALAELGQLLEDYDKL